MSGVVYNSYVVSDPEIRRILDKIASASLLRFSN